MGSYSEHFSNDELKCKCGCGKNECTSELVQALEAFRTAVGAPVTIDSAYRCPEHNKAVGGAENSQHVLGNAADVRVSGKSAADLEEIARTIPSIKGIGRSTPPMTYLHMDVREAPAQWTYDAVGKTAPYYALVKPSDEPLPA